MAIVREVCEHCGTEIRSGKKFCRNCGRPVVSPSLLLCEYCGAEIRPGKKFCRNCGQPVTIKKLHNRYVILGTIGQGGMGAIYKAKDIKLGNRLVAVKELKFPGLQKLEDLDKASRLFEQEALLLASLSHPALPDIYDHFSQHERWYFVMKYIPGETLTERLRKAPGECLSVNDALEISLKLCDVLEYLHLHTPPIIYGDLKPDNIMLTPEGNLYLIDFGIARLFQTAHGEDMNFVSRGYSPPEQYTTSQISPRADIYSFGVTLHQMLSGQRPAQNSHYFAPLPPGNRPWTADLNALIMSMVERDEYRRPGAMGEVKQKLQNIATQILQDMNTPANTSPWSAPAPPWGTPYGGYANPSYSNTLPFPSSTPPQPVEAPPLPAWVDALDIHLSLSNIALLAWSPDGSRLAAANSTDIHIYDWPLEKDFLSLEQETLVPAYTLSRSDLQALFPDVGGGEAEQDAPFPTFAAPPPPQNNANGEVAQGGYPTQAPTVVSPTGYAPVLTFAWVPDGAGIAITYNAGLYILNVLTQNVRSISTGNEGTITRVVWSPGGRYIAVGYENMVQVWEVTIGKKICDHELHTNYQLTAIAWSPDGAQLALAYSDYNTVPYGTSSIFIHVHKATTGEEICSYREHTSYVNDMLWASDGTYIVSCSTDKTVQVWNSETGIKQHSLEGHTDAVIGITFLDNDHLLASISTSGTVCIWNTETWALGEEFKMQTAISGWGYTLARGNLAFHPIDSLLAIAEPIYSTSSSVPLHLYRIDLDQLHLDPSKRSGVQYTNAKVVLIGDSGVGKSGLGLVLSHQEYAKTESTHGRVVWTFARRESRLKDGHKEIRETLLWDLAGQPGYRLIHQLHLSEVAIALVIFDAHSETDPFAGISHWVRALRTAQSIRGNATMLKMLLVQARIDRGGIRVSKIRIDELVQKLGFVDYFETSAKNGINIDSLIKGIENSIDWEQLPKVTSTELFYRIKTFLLEEKKEGRILSTASDLYRAFLRTWTTQSNIFDVSAEFATGIKLLESTGLIRQLSFGDLVLLQPELIDTYASALVNAARSEPDGLGSIAEETVTSASFFIPDDERLQNAEQEKLLLIAMVQDLLSYEIALREQGEDGPYLVFPSESTRENPDLPDPENASVVFTFEGPVRSIYATLAVRLSHSDFFVRKELWKNAIVYDDKMSGNCGMWLKEVDEGKGELTLFFDDAASYETRLRFEEFVRAQLQRKALAGSVNSRRIFRCQCGYAANEQLVRMRSEAGFTWFRCPICGMQVDLRDPRDRRDRPASDVSEMERSADLQRSRAAAQSTLQGKEETNDFDVFLCYNPIDRDIIKAIDERLKEHGILSFLDERDQRPGFSRQDIQQEQIRRITSAAVFVGKNGLEPWQQIQTQTLLAEFVNRGCPVIPVILPDVPADQVPNFPSFLRVNVWVDFRKPDPEPMKQLLFGITGDRKWQR